MALGGLPGRINALAERRRRLMEALQANSSVGSDIERSLIRASSEERARRGQNISDAVEVRRKKDFADKQADRARMFDVDALRAALVTAEDKSSQYDLINTPRNQRSEAAARGDTFTPKALQSSQDDAEFDAGDDILVPYDGLSDSEEAGAAAAASSWGDTIVGRATKDYGPQFPPIGVARLARVIYEDAKKTRPNVSYGDALVVAREHAAKVTEMQRAQQEQHWKEQDRQRDEFYDSRSKELSLAKRSLDYDIEKNNFLLDRDNVFADFYEHADQWVDKYLAGDLKDFDEDSANAYEINWYNRAKDVVGTVAKQLGKKRQEDGSFSNSDSIDIRSEMMKRLMEHKPSVGRRVSPTMAVDILKTPREKKPTKAPRRARSKGKANLNSGYYKSGAGLLGDAQQVRDTLKLVYDINSHDIDTGYVPSVVSKFLSYLGIEDPEMSKVRALSTQQFVRTVKAEMGGRASDTDLRIIKESIDAGQMDEDTLRKVMLMVADSKVSDLEKEVKAWSVAAGGNGNPAVRELNRQIDATLEEFRSKGSSIRLSTEQSLAVDVYKKYGYVMINVPAPGGGVRRKKVTKEFIDKHGGNPDVVIKKAVEKASEAFPLGYYVVADKGQYQ